MQFYIDELIKREVHTLTKCKILSLSYHYTICTSWCRARNGTISQVQSISPNLETLLRWRVEWFCEYVGPVITRQQRFNFQKNVGGSIRNSYRFRYTRFELSWLFASTFTVWSIRNDKLYFVSATVIHRNGLIFSFNYA